MCRNEPTNGIQYIIVMNTAIVVVDVGSLLDISHKR